MGNKWETAPEGAELYNPDTEMFYRQNGDIFEKFSNARQRWEEAAGRKEQYREFEERPTHVTGAA